jgi:hypothetical protein
MRFGWCSNWAFKFFHVIFRVAEVGEVGPLSFGCRVLQVKKGDKRSPSLIRQIFAKPTGQPPFNLILSHLIHRYLKPIQSIRRPFPKLDRAKAVLSPFLLRCFFLSKLDIFFKAAELLV